MRNKFIFGLLCLTLLTVILSACRVIDSATIPQNPKATMGTNNFISPTITIKKGDFLDLVDTVASPHTITNGKWSSSGKQEPAKEAGAPDAAADFKGGDVKTIGPFTQAGTYDIYCIIHPGMNLTITVK